ncbi:GNAT family N-acetyltransferase [Macrococcus brunensis]|uniref:GNAT family N-acetyltransferase n=1 Tax=Macrococcus brunensis TaxID=198483 RepID=UPI001EF0B2E4|nr:N-acetyltransferase [Macrococcus brunensis]ULG72055.1 GNAT family N-acetyltransferase [Macrococcus brunensis]ULG74308.1 GNAT family N-acetyltransferase [Macrococcus brunensis]
MEIEIVEATPDNPLGGALNYAALNDMSETMLGVSSKEQAIEGLQYLWQQAGNRFSHEYTLVATIESQTAGAITCMPVEKMDRAFYKTFIDIVRYRKLGVILYAIRNFKKMMLLSTMKEGEKGEYHISMLATRPDFRGQGVGSALLEAAEERGQAEGYDSISLTVKKDNDQALNVYESKGYKIVGDIDLEDIQLYRMRKIIAAKP